MTETWIPLLVQEQDYLELAAIVAERATQRVSADDAREVVVETISGSEASSPLINVASSALAKHRPWAVEDLHKLMTSGAITAQRWTRAIDVCAAHVGEFLSTQQIATESGMSVNEWRDAPRKISRHLASNYPNVNGKWPLAVLSGKSLGHSYDQAYWAITEEQAARWATAREAAK
ncbi:hypothetical protein [uncultured Microbacterium sp.]|uniref:hypothetical protein n=1 Tax=uncultured Microbacterium sp. TaxID=191216 RepID=UPI00260C6161|nr:hypothetical protein [uncultured Microbacterium sp.]